LKDRGTVKESIALGQQFGKTPSAIVAMARRQKGLPDLQATDRDLALAEIPKSEMAKIASLGEFTPLQMVQRAQINSGQQLQGTDEQRTSISRTTVAGDGLRRYLATS
jgi:hypothetical protein